MADVTISNLTNRQPNSSAVFPYSEGGTTYNASLNQVIPTGVIVMWSGSIVSIPAGWALCDGNNGTPNLVDRFVLGAGTSTPAVGATGGSKDAIVVAHTHTITDPGHFHSITTPGGGTSAGPAAGGGAGPVARWPQQHAGQAPQRARLEEPPAALVHPLGRGLEGLNRPRLHARPTPEPQPLPLRRRPCSWPCFAA